MFVEVIRYLAKEMLMKSPCQAANFEKPAGGSWLPMMNNLLMHVFISTCTSLIMSPILSVE
uniref:Uncharacterized protein n=1 Tax=Arundo donax TaxID=35708 RepID=A0A0A9F0Y3_ARUDO